MSEVWNHLPAIQKAFPGLLGKVIRKACFDAQAKAMDLCPVATGFLKSSIYVITKDTNTYGQTEGSGPLLPPLPTPSSETDGWVAVGASYGLFVEMGTRHMAAQPFLQPAVESILPELTRALETIEAAIGRVR